LIQIIGLEGIPLIKKDDDIAAIILEAARRQGTELEEGDIVVVTQKIVSKSEGRILDLSRIVPSSFALHVAKQTGRDPRHVEVILRESKRIVKMQDQHLIVETRHGFVCANGGVDKSNIEGEKYVSILPVNPDESARAIRAAIKRLSGVDVAVIISDTFGRPWRMGHVNVAIGVSGMKPIIDYRGLRDMFNLVLTVTVMAVADEIASAAELVMNKSDGVPVAIVRGYPYRKEEGKGVELIRPAELDLFR
jgi:coenzyme F420-0:L-glutamate ligase/coenzyme F420-1:gamma-L-glutamate ligase